MKRLILIAMVVLLLAPNVLAQNFCQGDFNYNGNVAAEDVTVFLDHFGRSQYNNPCPPDGPAPVPRTGQITSYMSGDDADLVRGVLWPVPRFADNSDGTITDNLTGLIWLKNANCFDGDWGEAITGCYNLGEPDCGLTDGSGAGDWRLPNRFELESLLKLEHTNPALPNTTGTGQWSEGNPFNNVQTDYYQSSSSYPQPTGGTANWSVNMGNGDVNHQPKDSLNYVWCVRGGH